MLHWFPPKNNKLLRTKYLSWRLDAREEYWHIIAASGSVSLLTIIQTGRAQSWGSELSCSASTLPTLGAGVLRGDGGGDGGDGGDVVLLSLRSEDWSAHSAHSEPLTALPGTAGYQLAGPGQQDQGRAALTVSWGGSYSGSSCRCNSVVLQLSCQPGLTLLLTKYILAVLLVHCNIRSQARLDTTATISGVTLEILSTVPASF